MMALFIFSQFTYPSLDVRSVTAFHHRVNLQQTYLISLLFVSSETTVTARQVTEFGYSSRSKQIPDRLCGCCEEENPRVIFVRPPFHFKENSELKQKIHFGPNESWENTIIV